MLLHTRFYILSFLFFQEPRVKLMNSIRRLHHPIANGSPPSPIIDHSSQSQQSFMLKHHPNTRPVWNPSLQFDRSLGGSALPSDGRLPAAPLPNGISFPPSQLVVRRYFIQFFVLKTFCKGNFQQSQLPVIQLVIGIA